MKLYSYTVLAESITRAISSSICTQHTVCKWKKVNRVGWMRVLPFTVFRSSLRGFINKLPEADAVQLKKIVTFVRVETSFAAGDVVSDLLSLENFY